MYHLSFMYESNYSSILLAAHLVEKDLLESGVAMHDSLATRRNLRREQKS